MIANKTFGEHSAGDVEGDALTVALELRDKFGHTLDFDKPEFRSVLFQHLYQRVVRYTDTHVRFAARLDHGPDGEDGEGMCLHERLASDASFDPLQQLLQNEAASKVAELAPHTTLAAAYVRLLEVCNYQMGLVAESLYLSISYTYQRFAHARMLATSQQPLKLSAPAADFSPGPWRKYKLRRPPVQLSLDFQDEAQIFGV